jgi:phage FluMu protein Com
MPAISIRCTRCGARLKASEGKAKVRCPGCGTVLQVPPATEALAEETPDRLEEVDDAAAPERRRHGDEDDRPRRGRRRRGPEPAWMEYLWLASVGVAAVCFVISFGITLLAVGLNGLPAETEWGAYLEKVGALAFAVFAALAFVVMGAYYVKKREIIGRWGEVITGPFAVILGAVITALGGSLGGFAVYALLLALVRGR